MNTDPREFDLQERALRDDPAWRDVAQALRVSPGEPPADFAASVAAFAEAAPARAAAAGGGEGDIERWLLRALSVVLAVIGAGVLAIDGGAWLGSVAEGFGAVAAGLGGSGALNWALAAGACMALSWAFARGAPSPPPLR
jgi:hypothetical protein